MKRHIHVGHSFLIFILVPLSIMTVVLLSLFMVFRARIEEISGVPITQIPDDLRELVATIILIIIFVLFLTGVILSFWLYQNVTGPLQRLGAATRLISDGAYDFEIEEEGPEEIRELCRDFEKMKVRLKDASEAQLLYDKESKELISNISHDLRTPIAAVKGYVEGIMDGVADTPEKMDHYVRTIYNKANEMDHLIGELTFYSRIDTNRMPYAFANINARRFFDDAAADIALELEEQGIAFSYSDTVPSSVEVVADAEQIHRVISNIISNSLKYMEKENKEVSLSVTVNENEVCAAIRDNGRGISENDLAFIFDRFYRTDESRHAPQGGSGIGLSIVKKIIEDHGGRVWAESVEGKETTIYFTLRTVEDENEKDQKPVRHRGAKRQKELKEQAKQQEEKRNEQDPDH